MKHRFRFWANLTASGDSFEWILEADEFTHLAKVLKLKVGDEIEVQNLAGEWAIATLTQVEKQESRAVSGCVNKQPQPAQILRVVMGALKPQDLDTVLPSMVELGVSEIYLFLTEQSEKRRIDEKYLERWQRILKTAAKQCKRAGIPSLRAFENLESLLASDFFADDRRLVFDPAGEKSLADIAAEFTSTSTTVVVGSEAGLSTNELELLRSKGFTPVNCGPYILRGLTAAILASSLAKPH